ncbi:porin family protein [Vibrio harveyi]|uniref:porin family protein n=1 Tax=Vibrio harveyi TaxID=669 RepID=UPI000680FAA3|nr:porin family protein [Vibrio harveyi]EKO3845518.1 porin family protein [Vibrio harveyi]HDM8146921.1 porin family protein [Vibrio harveyi]HDM8165244.1 porin family protein [Vibrio harveyi]
MKKVFLLTALVSSFASANDMSGFYLGAGIGNTDFDDAGYMNDVSHAIALDSGASVPLTSDSDGSAYKLIAGYQINRIVAIEAQYTKYADTDVKVQNISVLKLSHDTFTVAANVGYTFDNGLRPFATLGLGSISYEVKENFTGNNFKKSESGGTVRLGVGLEYAPVMLGGLAFRAGYEVDHYTLETTFKDYDQSVGSWYVGSTYKF